MVKKTKKVKKKLLKYTKTKKKKNVKKKSVKRKVIKKKKIKQSIKKIKKTKKTLKKRKYTKKVKRKRKKKMTIDDLYKIINKVQSKRKPITFITELIEASTMENIIKDTIDKYDKKIMVTQVMFTLYPNPEDNYDDMLKVEYMDDEIIEEGQIFP